MWLIFVQVIAGFILALFTVKDMFEAPAWNFIKSPLSGDAGSVLVTLSTVTLVFSLLPWGVKWWEERRTRRIEGPPLAPQSQSDISDPTILWPIIRDLIELRFEADKELTYPTPIFSDLTRARARQRLSRLNVYGIQTPKLDGRSPEKELERLCSYVDTLRPALDAGNIMLARREAEEWLAARQLQGHS
jgi:hypothetical protein